MNKSSLKVESFIYFGTDSLDMTALIGIVGMKLHSKRVGKIEKIGLLENTLETSGVCAQVCRQSC